MIDTNLVTAHGMVASIDSIDSTCKPLNYNPGYQQPMRTYEWSDEFTEFKSNVNFEFKNQFTTG